ncbi:MAG: nuclear transport factor 2 family protein [Gemmatimonadetes bacterium]|nr:nuclear transport factor 2 family protein [Gemmatimonadota bacterium]
MSNARDRIILALALALGTVAARPAPAQATARATADGADARAIRAQRERSNVAIARHDTAGVAAILAPHVTVLTSNSVSMVGRQTNAERFADQFRTRPDVVYRRTPSQVKVFAPWRMASEQGRWAGSWTDVDGKISVGGAYFAKWRQIGAIWLVESETYVPEYCEGGKYCQTIP